jgi:hypothetical protein
MDRAGYVPYTVDACRYREYDEREGEWMCTNCQCGLSGDVCDDVDGFPDGCVFRGYRSGTVFSWRF